MLPGWRWSGSLHWISKSRSNFLTVLFLLVLFWHSVHIPRSKSCSSSVFLRSCSHSEGLELMERGLRQAGWTLWLSSDASLYVQEHMQIYTLALQESPPGLLGFPKCFNSQSSKDASSNTPFFISSKIYFLLFFYVPSSWEEFGLKCVCWKAPDENSKPKAHQQQEEGQPKLLYLSTVPSSQNHPWD